MVFKIGLLITISGVLGVFWDAMVEGFLLGKPPGIIVNICFFVALAGISILIFDMMCDIFRERM